MGTKFIKRFGYLTTFLLITIIVSVYAIDPFYHYHAPYFNLRPVIENELNQNPGIAEHFEYDSIILGSSMAQNFTVSKFEEVFPEGGHTVKLTYSAIRTGNMDWMLKKAFAKHEIKNVYLGLDLDPFIDEYGDYYFPLPEYLHDDNPLNDVNYLLNKEVLVKATEMVENNIRDEIPNVDDAYKWGAVFSEEEALSTVTWDMLKWEEPHVEEVYLANTKENFQKNLLPHIENHPETTFYIFFPPYSILWWNMKLSDGTIENFLGVEEYLIKELIRLKNVKLFGIQTEREIVTNLDNYKDYNHYSPQINDKIMYSMSQETYILTEKNYKEYLKDLKCLVYEYDYSQYGIN